MCHPGRPQSTVSGALVGALSARGAEGSAARADLSGEDLPPHARGAGGFGSRDERRGQIATLKDAQTYLDERHGIVYPSLNGVWAQLRKHQIKLKTGRRRHALADAAARRPFAPGFGTTSAENGVQRVCGPLMRVASGCGSGCASGGDLRGQQSAALLIVAGEGKRFDLRVEDHLTPLAELRRLLQLARAYRFVEEADAAVGQGQYDNAAEAYEMAMGLAPEIAELKAWATIAMVQMGQEREAMTLFETAFRADPGLVELVPRVAALTRTCKTTLIRVCARSSRLLKRVQEPVA